MAYSKVEQLVFEMAEPIAASADVSIWDVEFKKEGKENVLRVFIDKEGGVSIDDCETVIINRGKDTAVVLISLDEYNSLKETEYIMSSPETVEAIRKGDEEIKNGKGIKVELEDLWK